MKRSISIQKEILNTSEAAELLNVTAQTIKNYIYAGKLKSLKTPGGHHRIRRSDLESIGFSLSKSQMGSGVTREDMFIQYNQLLEAYKKTIEVLLKALDQRDAIGSGHSARVADYASWMADILNLSLKERENIMMAALLHDVGKIWIKEDILSKNGKLNSEEIAIVQKHPEIGEKIVKEADCLKSVQSLIRHHHERFDGKGYPDGLKGEKIPIGARIISLAETYDFLRANLSFRPSFSPEESVAEIKKFAGSQFDPSLVKVFVENLSRRAFH
jgi:excisionase family DNA binding protein